MSPKKTAYENPLIPNARLKQMYRAILRAHLLGQSLPPTQRALTATREAALVSSALDLTARDFVLDAFATPVLDLLRGTPLHRIQFTNRMTHPGSAWVGSDSAARIHAALGAASALKSAAALAKKSAKESDTSSLDSAVALCIFISGEVTAGIWQSALPHAAQHDLPVIFLVLPPTASKTSRSTEKADLRAIAHKAGLPAIPVDAADPVALYRVAQESIGHARIGGGPALIQCVAFPATAPQKSASTAAAANPAIAHPAIAHLADYILSRSIATRAWMDREAASFAAQLRTLKSQNAG
jgi:TPP-dependent pyruvate/acetoin dehydrogenase alpha subunit